jgi:hypothetical protein
LQLASAMQASAVNNNVIFFIGKDLRISGDCFRTYFKKISSVPAVIFTL